MSEWNFIKVEHEQGDSVRVHIVHPRKPSMVVEFLPKFDEQGKMVGGDLKRICAENSPSGQYHLYPKVVKQAEKFFLQSLNDGPVPLPRALG
ncbi:MAG: hypothetical protein ACFB21_12100 [Opitutales bacterium]